MNWAYGLTTVPARRYDLLPRTLESLAEAGFPEPRLFVDGAEQGFDGFHVTYRFPRVKTVANWWLGLAELYHREPFADRYAMFQDDVVFVRNLRHYMEWGSYPEKGYLNLYNVPYNEKRGKGTGWYRTEQNGYGALALVFSNEAAVELLAARSFLLKPKTAGRKSYASLDGGIVHAMNSAGWGEYVHKPGLCQHIGQHASAMGNKQDPLSGTFPGESFDAVDLCSPNS